MKNQSKNIILRAEDFQGTTQKKMGRNSVSMQYLFTAKVNQIKIRLDDHPETDRAIHTEKTAM